MALLEPSKGVLDFGLGLADAQEELGGATKQVVNVLRDAAGWLRLMPGTSDWDWTPRVVSASALTLTGGGRFFIVTGTVGLDHLKTAGWSSGDIVALKAESGLTVAHNAGSAPAGYAAIQTRTGSAKAVAAGEVIYLTYDGTDWEELSAATAQASLEVIGITEFDGKIVWVTKDRRIWFAEASGLVTALSDSTAATKLDGSERPVFASMRTRLFIAGGGRMQYWDKTGLSARVTNGPIASHVVGNATRVLALNYDNTGQFQWTNPGEGQHLTAAGWDALNFVEAEARPDAALALHENSDEIFVFGKRTVQIFAPDANVGYAPQQTMNTGLGARQSVINLLEKRLFAWINEDGEAVLSSAREAEPLIISRPHITKTLRDLARADCYGNYLKFDNFRLLQWQFPTNGETLLYDVDHQRWFRARGYDSGIGDYARWPVTAAHVAPEQNLVFVGLASGQVAVLDVDATTVDGQILKGEVILGYSNRGTETPKGTLRVRAPVRRGVGSFGTSTPPKIELSWRDRPGSFSNPLQLSLGAAEQNRPYIMKTLTTRPYVRRQWRLQMAAGVPVSLGPIEETFEVLED